MELDPAFLAFVFVTTAFPGPNAALMLVVGLRHGVRAGVPILCGIAVANAAIKIGVAAAVQGTVDVAALPLTVLQWPALAFCLWMVWRITSSDALLRVDGSTPPARVPPRFGNGVAFQLANPKAWVTSAAAATLFLVPGAASPSPWLFGLVALPAVLLGAGGFLVLGETLATRLCKGRAARALNIVSATALCAVVGSIVIAQL